MKFFATICSFVGVALLGTVAVVAQDKSELVSGIELITNVSAAVNKTISSLNAGNFFSKGYVCLETALSRRPGSSHAVGRKWPKA